VLIRSLALATIIGTSKKTILITTQWDKIVQSHLVEHHEVSSALENLGTVAIDWIKEHWQEIAEGAIRVFA